MRPADRRRLFLAGRYGAARPSAASYRPPSRAFRAGGRGERSARWVSGPAPSRVGGLSREARGGGGEGSAGKPARWHCPGRPLSGDGPRTKPGDPAPELEHLYPLFERRPEGLQVAARPAKISPAAMVRHSEGRRVGPDSFDNTRGSLLICDSDAGMECQSLATGYPKPGLILGTQSLAPISSWRRL